MPRRPSMTNVRLHIEQTRRFTEYLLAEHAKARPGGVFLPPLFESEARQIKLLAEAILRIHSEKAASGNRKDIYVERTTR